MRSCRRGMAHIWRSASWKKALPMLTYCLRSSKQGLTTELTVFHLVSPVSNQLLDHVLVKRQGCFDRILSIFLSNVATAYPEI